MENIELGEQIRRLREKAGVLAKVLADDVGLDASAISNIESGKRSVKTIELTNIAKSLGVSPLAILEPESLLARLPIAARTTTAEMDEAVHSRLTALAEIHNVLAAAGISSTKPNIEYPEIHRLDWLSGARELAKWAASRCEFDDEHDRFGALARTIEDEMGIDVLVEPCEEASALGAAITDPEFPIIFINANQRRARALFTLAHELGHVLAQDGETLLVDRSLEGTTQQEKFANAFAAELLMPVDEIASLIKDFGRSAQTLSRIMLRFQVSFQSMVYRLHNLGFLTTDGRDSFKQMGMGGLLSEIEDSEERSALIELGTKYDQWRAPRLLTERLLKGYNDGVISIRPLAGLLNQDPDELMEILSKGSSQELDIANSLAENPTHVNSEEERFAGSPN